MAILKKYIRTITVAVFAIILLISAVGCSLKTDNTSVQETKSTTQSQTEQKSPNGALKIHFLNVGQADSILVENNGAYMLIDAGNNADGDMVVNYLKGQGVKKLDTLVLTHSHEDHIGGADNIINTFTIDKLYMPKGDSSTTKTFRSVVTAIKSKGLKATEPIIGSSFKVGEATATILASNGTNYEDANDYSIVIRLVYGENSFLLTGDAEKLSEKEMLAKGIDLKSTVLKIGHHGSYSSSSAAFLDKVKPRYAILSCGDGNDYGLPHKSAMMRLKERGITVYRTDESGTIVMTSDGKNITFNTKPGSYKYGKDK